SNGDRKTTRRPIGVADREFTIRSQPLDIEMNGRRRGHPAERESLITIEQACVEVGIAESASHWQSPRLSAERRERFRARNGNRGRVYSTPGSRSYRAGALAMGGATSERQGFNSG